MTALPELYRSLLQQIVHRDFDASNVLMEGDRVTGVLDFEFAGSDLRAFDLARSRSLFRKGGRKTPGALALGYKPFARFSRFSC